MSYYLPEHRALYLHIPRTGGTWTGFAFNRCNVKTDNRFGWPTLYRARKHVPLAHYSKEDLNKVDLFFSSVRNPIDYYESVWRQMARGIALGNQVHGIKKDRWHCHGEASLLYQPDFSDWVRVMTEQKPGWLTELYESFVGTSDNPICKYICRLENIVPDFGRMMDILGLKRSFVRNIREVKRIRHGKRATRVDLIPRVEWTDGLKDLIYNSERVVFDRFYSYE